MAVVAAAVLGALVMAFIETCESPRCGRGDADAERGACEGWSRGLRRGGTMLYHSAVLLLAGDDLEWRGAPARTFRIGFLFLALVTTATYTANLAAFLTQPNLQIHGPRNMEELRSAVACVEYDEVAPTLGSLVAGTMSPDSEAPGEFGYGDIEARSAFCVDRVTAGDADIYISNDVNVHLAGLGGNCDKLHQPTGIQLGPFHLYAATRDPALARNVSRSMDALYTYSSLYEVFDARYKRSETCAEESAGETTQIKVKDMRGLFVIFAVISAAAVAAAAWEASAALRRSDNAAQSTDHLESMADAIRRLEGKLDEALAREDKIGAAIFDKLRVDAARPSAGASRPLVPLERVATGERTPFCGISYLSN